MSKTITELQEAIANLTKLFQAQFQIPKTVVSTTMAVNY